MDGILGIIVFYILGSQASKKGYSFAYGCLGPLFGTALSLVALMLIIALSSLISPGQFGAGLLLMTIPLSYILGLYLAYSRIQRLPDKIAMQSTPCPLCESLQTESMGSTTLFCYACNESSYFDGKKAISMTEHHDKLVQSLIQHDPAP